MFVRQQFLVMSTIGFLFGAGAGTSFWTFASWVMLSRVGIGLVMPALQMGALQNIEPLKLAQASEPA